MPENKRSESATRTLDATSYRGQVRKMELAGVPPIDRNRPGDGADGLVAIRKETELR